MKKNLLRFLIAFLILGAAGAYYAWYEFNRTEESTADKEVEAIFPADSLASLFENDDSSATALYGGKILQVEGTAEECSAENGKIRIKLTGTGMSGILCQFEASDSVAAAAVDEGSLVCLKGQCDAYQTVEMLPGGDLYLSRCVIVKK
ncbi:MAG: hypothetical protein RL213_1831 [Bacteroidota bacterium]|jgi:hypothetical protein